MKKTSETVVFFGSGPVAAESLKKLAINFSIEAVITKPKPEHHKYPFPVIEAANKLGLKLLYTVNRTELDQLFTSHSFKSRIGIVIDYGILISEKVISSFPLGIINSHFSLLPKYRGADPISFSLLSGDETTGVSLMKIVPALDEGPLIAQAEIKIDNLTTTPELTDQLIELSDKLLEDYLPDYLLGNLAPRPQPNNGVSYTRKLTKQDSVLDFNKPAEELERQVRAFIGWPRSRTTINGKDVIVTKTHVSSADGKPGELWSDGKQVGFFTKKGSLIIDKLIPAGKKEMDSSAFIAGYLN